MQKGRQFEKMLNPIKNKMEALFTNVIQKITWKGFDAKAVGATDNERDSAVNNIRVKLKELSDYLHLYLTKRQPEIGLEKEQFLAFSERVKTIKKIIKKLLGVVGQLPFETRTLERGRRAEFLGGIRGLIKNTENLDGQLVRMYIDEKYKNVQSIIQRIKILNIYIKKTVLPNLRKQLDKTAEKKELRFRGPSEHES